MRGPSLGLPASVKQRKNADAAARRAAVCAPRDGRNAQLPVIRRRLDERVASTPIRRHANLTLSFCAGLGLDPFRPRVDSRLRPFLGNAPNG
jgi:hypothetical protein